MIVVLVPLVEDDVEVADVDGAHLPARDLYGEAIHREALQGGEEPLLVGAEVQQGPHHHVTADATLALQIEGLSHGRSTFLRG